LCFRSGGTRSLSESTPFKQFSVKLTVSGDFDLNLNLFLLIIALLFKDVAKEREPEICIYSSL
jgi:hypothetical protein